MQRAALELIADRGYDQTTVAEIAVAAGLTERTFFRYFADKREVLFASQDRFIALVVDALIAAPPDLAPLEAVVTAFGASTTWFDERRALAQARQGVIDAHPDLQERELAKIAKLSTAMTQALSDRGVSEPQAALAAAAGVAAFRFGFAQWLADADGHDLESHVLSGVDELRKVIAI
ncbi:transcriptional regulator, TetR family [Actinopolyspora mzabensis]|uniref:Transcriptional regulator, TetR family n=1 Tax=Actinopolyspora mzabensis TaxID=995066 RepID=A0A1G8Y7I4_ACTMZ|nr:transcriptional regulator, TetR family [Actinopolyspora mzabensis]